MGIGLSLAAGMFIGIVAGVIITIPLVYLKTWWERRKAINKTDRDTLIKIIKSEQEEQNGNSKEETRGGESSGTNGDGTREPDTVSTESESPNQTLPKLRDRVQVSNPSFTLRD